MSDADADRWERVLEAERTLAIRDRGRIVAGTGIFSRRLAVPGGVVPAAAVTLVGVRPTHRRRGLMSTLMRRQLNDVHERGREAVTVLWASEPVIYGRFGYGLGTHAADLRVASGSARLRSAPDARVDLLTPTEALPAIRELHEALWPTIPGMLDREDPWWEDRIEDPEEHREGNTPLRAAVTEDAYALYAVKRQWDENGPDSEVVVLEALAATPEGEAAIWNYLIGLDLTRRISWDLAPVRPPAHAHGRQRAGREDDPRLRVVGAPGRRAARAGGARLRRAVRGRARGRGRRAPVERRPLGAALGRHDRHLREDRHPGRARSQLDRARRRLPRRDAARDARPRRPRARAAPRRAGRRRAAPSRATARPGARRSSRALTEW